MITWSLSAIESLKKLDVLNFLFDIFIAFPLINLFSNLTFSIRGTITSNAGVVIASSLIIINYKRENSNDLLIIFNLWFNLFSNSRILFCKAVSFSIKAASLASRELWRVLYHTNKDFKPFSTIIRWQICDLQQNWIYFFRGTVHQWH